MHYITLHYCITPHPLQSNRTILTTYVQHISLLKGGVREYHQEVHNTKYTNIVLDIYLKLLLYMYLILHLYFQES